MRLFMVSRLGCGCRFVTTYWLLGPQLLQVVDVGTHRCSKHRRIRDRLYFHPKRIAL